MSHQDEEREVFSFCFIQQATSQFIAKWPDQLWYLAHRFSSALRRWKRMANSLNLNFKTYFYIGREWGRKNSSRYSLLISPGLSSSLFCESWLDLVRRAETHGFTDRTEDNTRAGEGKEVKTDQLNLLDCTDQTRNQCPEHMKSWMAIQDIFSHMWTFFFSLCIKWIAFKARNCTVGFRIHSQLI